MNSRTQTTGVTSGSAPSQLVAQPAPIADPACNGGHGIALSAARAPLTDNQQFASTAMGDGSTVVAYNAHRSLVLVSLTGGLRAEQ